MFEILKKAAYNIDLFKIPPFFLIKNKFLYGSIFSLIISIIYISLYGITLIRGLLSTLKYE